MCIYVYLCVSMCVHVHTFGNTTGWRPLSTQPILVHLYILLVSISGFTSLLVFLGRRLFCLLSRLLQLQSGRVLGFPHHCRLAAADLLGVHVLQRWHLIKPHAFGIGLTTWRSLGLALGSGYLICGQLFLHAKVLPQLLPKYVHWTVNPGPAKHPSLLLHLLGSILRSAKAASLSQAHQRPQATVAICWYFPRAKAGIEQSLEALKLPLILSNLFQETVKLHIPEAFFIFGIVSIDSQCLHFLRVRIDGIMKVAKLRMPKDVKFISKVLPCPNWQPMVALPMVWRLIIAPDGQEVPLLCIRWTEPILRKHKARNLEALFNQLLQRLDLNLQVLLSEDHDALLAVALAQHREIQQSKVEAVRLNSLSVTSLRHYTVVVSGPIHFVGFTKWRGFPLISQYLYVFILYLYIWICFYIFLYVYINIYKHPRWN